MNNMWEEGKYMGTIEEMLKEEKEQIRINDEAVESAKKDLLAAYKDLLVFGFTQSNIIELLK